MSWIEKAVPRVNSEEEQRGWDWNLSVFDSRLYILNFVVNAFTELE